MRKLQKTFYFVFLLPFMLFTNCQAGEKSNDSHSTIKKGTQLIYQVDANGMSYDFIVSIKSASSSDGIQFDWQMTDPVNTSGKVTIQGAALANASKYKNYFSNNSDVKLNADESTVFLSDKLGRESLFTDGEVNMMDLGDGLKGYEYLPRYSDFSDYLVNGEAVDYFGYTLYNSESENQLVFIQIDGFYLIAGMFLDFDIYLKEIKY
jgi:hypothetical protein